MKYSATLLAFWMASNAFAQGDYPFCQILDRVESPAWEAHASFTLPANVPQTGKDLSYLGLAGGGGLGYYRADAGDIDFTGAYDVNFLADDGGLDLPNTLGALNLKAAFTYRTAEGQGLRISASPGIYSDLEDITLQSVYVPFAVEGILAFAPDVSGLLGMAFYPGFDQFLEPRAGIRWAVNESLLIDLMYPESRVTIFPLDGWEMYAGLKSSQAPEWNVEDGRSSVMLDEFRSYVGVSHPLTDEFRMMYQAGWAFNREVDFDKQAPEADLDDALFLSVGIGGAL